MFYVGLHHCLTFVFVCSQSLEAAAVAAAWDSLLDLEALLVDRQHQEQHVQLATPYYNAWRDAQDVEAGRDERGMLTKCISW